MKWFRFYAEVLHDPKVQRLPAQLFKDWVNVMCCASARDGHIPRDIEDFAFCMRLTRPRAEKLLLDLKDAGLVDITPDSIKPHNWDSRQYISDSSTPRVKRFRDKRKSISETLRETFQDSFRNGHVTANETAPEQNRTEQNRTEEFSLQEDHEKILSAIKLRHRSAGYKYAIKTTLVEREWAAALEKRPDDLIGHAKRIDEGHRKACETNTWQNQFIEALDKWIAREGWRDDFPAPEWDGYTVVNPEEALKGGGL